MTILQSTGAGADFLRFTGPFREVTSNGSAFQMGNVIVSPGVVDGPFESRPEPEARPYKVEITKEDLEEQA